MSQGATFEAEDSKYRFVSLFTRRKSLIITTRLRLLPFFLVVCFTATTALSTTFPFQSNNNNKNRNTNNNDNKKKNSNFHINTNGLPSKHPGQIISQILHQTNIHSDILTSTLITGSTHFTPPTEQGKKVDHDEDNEDDKTQTNDTDDESKKEEKIQMADDQKFKERIQSSIHTVQNWETVEWLQECRDIIPWDDLRNETGPYSRPEQDRLLADDSNALFLQRLCRWFPKFMTWVNAPPCSKCGSKDCEMKTVREPETEEEKEGNAKRVEVYFCPSCKENTTTFPRYNKAQKLLETRTGRCGEYSNLFGLFCRAVGFETRLILDLSDHLWTEVRIGDNWVMADACEGIIDKPSMYEYGWGKDGLCYMIAIGSDHVTDVTTRYTRKFLTDDFQTRRRAHTTTENATTRILYELNQVLRRNLTKAALDELTWRQQFEEAELQLYKQSTEWTPQEKYGRGRISGSLAWKRSRQEAGKSTKDGDQAKTKERQVAGFEIEAFSPPISTTLSLQVRPKPTGRHDGIVVAETACAIGEADSISVVVVDEHCLGCILQSQSFVTWTDVEEFVNRLPSERIVLMNGKCEEDPKVKSFQMPRLGGWIKDDVVNKGVAFIGQVDAQPDWAYCSTLNDCPPEGCEVVLQVDPSRRALKLRKECYTLPSKVAGRLPDHVMTLKAQVMANEEQKRVAAASFLQSTNRQYAGYSTKPGAPVYFLDSTSYPLNKMDATAIAVMKRENAWSTFHFLPQPLVPQDEDNVFEMPGYEVPLEADFFNGSLGTQLLTNNTTLLPTSDALRNARLVGLYFSAHWCGPCRSFTPMLSEMYSHLKDHRPRHGLEIVFVSSDRDANTFSTYFGTMPWQAIPFEHAQSIKGNLNLTYGVRGIPSLVILDAVTGQVVVSASESRQAVGMACRGGEQQIEALLDSWLERVPQETKEIIAMLELSCQEDIDGYRLNDEKESPYLFSGLKSAPTADTAGRIKHFFEKLVADGNDPTSAAAKAIGLVADEQKLSKMVSPGSLDGKAIRRGPIQTISGFDEALMRVKECNSPSVVVDVLTVTMKYLKNTAKEPWSTKFRNFKLSNKIADQITCIDGGLRLLQNFGFEIYGTNQEFKATIPVSIDLENANRTLSRLLQEYGRNP